MMKKLVISAVPVILAALLASAGCSSGSVSEPAANAQPPAGQAGTAATGSDITITAMNLAYPAYIAAPSSPGTYPGIVLIHSFNGLEPGYRTLVDRFAADGYVVIAPEWQTINTSPPDEEVGSLITAGVAYLKSRPDVDPARLGLTGFCAGGRYTMLFLPQMPAFRAGVAWYGFPYNAGFANETRPIDHLGSLAVPMLMIHGSADMASPVTDIYKYSTALAQAKKYYELKVYEGEPHGFMIVNGSLNGSDVANDAFGEMVRFFNRTLKGPGITS